MMQLASHLPPTPPPSPQPPPGCSVGTWKDTADAAAAAPPGSRLLGLPLLAPGGACLGVLLLGLPPGGLTQPALRLGLLLAAELVQRHVSVLAEVAEGVAGVLGRPRVVGVWPGHDEGGGSGGAGGDDMEEEEEGDEDGPASDGSSSSSDGGEGE